MTYIVNITHRPIQYTTYNRTTCVLLTWLFANMNSLFGMRNRYSKT